MAFYGDDTRTKDNTRVIELYGRIYSRSQLNLKEIDDVDRLREYLIADANRILESAEELLGLLCRRYE
ncbi:MAG: hypothetical protein E7Z65_06275 [Thermoplasmata archaeon]|nr:hypothetical protein [Thermoplasmata archaeon]